MDKETVCLMAARASRTENQDAIDTAIVGILADPKEVRDSKSSHGLVLIRVLIFTGYDCAMECLPSFRFDEMMTQY